jgi:hypothetical protein
MFVSFKASEEKKNCDFKLQKEDPLLNRNVEQHSETCFPPKSKRIFLKESEGMNHFINTAHHAFANHHGFALYPDHIWLLCLQAFSTKLASDPKKYGKVFLKEVNVGNDGKIIKKEIIIRRDDFVRKGKNPWEEVFPEFRKAMDIKNENFVTPQFSTSTVVSNVACDIALMDMLQSFFEYTLWTKCGIPEIKVYGTVTDYEKLLILVEHLASQLDMNVWFWHFNYTIQKFICFMKGIKTYPDEDYVFFKSFYKYNSGSGGSDVTGWINVFFPFLRDGKYNLSVDWFTSNSQKRGIDPIKYPTGISIAPVIWDYIGTKFNYEFCAGMIGTSVTEENDLTPTIGWFVKQK